MSFDEHEWEHHPRFGQVRLGQNTIACSGCGRWLHTACVLEANTTIAWHHLWFYRMREFIEEHRLQGQEVALCTRCHEGLSEQIVGNYRALERFDEGARFLEEFGWSEEDLWSSRVPKRTEGSRGDRREPKVLEGTEVDGTSTRIPKRTRRPREYR